VRCQPFLYTKRDQPQSIDPHGYFGTAKSLACAGFALIAVVAVTAASVVGQIATYPNLEPWYASLTKPSFNPPNWVFGPVWTTLYVLMAFALWRILRLPAGSMRRTGLTLFFIQLALNAA
jgi:tryptophan-rich sensory protein